MDRLGQDVDRDVRLDRQDALVDRGRGVRAGHRRPDELAGRAVHDDRDVADRGLDGVAPGARREVGHELEGVQAGVARLVEGESDGGRLGIRVGGARQGAVVGRTGSPSAIRTASSPW